MPWITRLDISLQKRSQGPGGQGEQVVAAHARTFEAASRSYAHILLGCALALTLHERAGFERVARWLCGSRVYLSAA